MSNSHIDIEEYIDLHELLELDHSTHEINRQFGLAHKDLLGAPILLLKRWIEEQRYLLSAPVSSKIIVSYLNRATTILLVVAFFLGIFSGFGLLSYSGHEPVNILYFLGAVLLLPMVTMSMTIWAMIMVNHSSSMVIHVSPAYWMEKMIALLPDKSRDIISNIHINPQISNSITIKRSQILALGFSLGLLLALLGVVTTRDIAFGWSSTLRITSQELYHFTSLIALPWSKFLPEALPSLELIEKSHYFRLGGELSADMVRSASLLGEWWKFLLMTTLFYALFLRFILFIWASVGLRKALKRGVLSIDGTQEMLSEMRRPLITTEAIISEDKFVQSRGIITDATTTTNQSFSTTIGWAIGRDTIALQNDRRGIEDVKIYEAGGMNSLESDQQVVESVSTNTLLYVKSWEPPTMDFIDFLIELAQYKERYITVYPLGSPEHNYKATDRDYDMWMLKIGGTKLKNIRMQR